MRKKLRKYIRYKPCMTLTDSISISKADMQSLQRWTVHQYSFFTLKNLVYGREEWVHLSKKFNLFDATERFLDNFVSRAHNLLVSFCYQQISYSLHKHYSRTLVISSVLSGRSINDLHSLDMTLKNNCRSETVSFDITRWSICLRST
jgi:hypothetical protein